MNTNVITNTWMDATVAQPFYQRTVLVRYDDGEIGVGMWNGAYWTNPRPRTRIDRSRTVTHFYVFERFIDANNY